MKLQKLIWIFFCIYILVITRFVYHSFTIHHQSLETGQLVSHTTQAIQSIGDLRYLYATMKYRAIENVPTQGNTFTDARREDSSILYQRIATIQHLVRDNPTQQRFIDTLKVLVSDQLSRNFRIREMGDQHAPGSSLLAVPRPGARIGTILDSLAGAENRILQRQLSENKQIADNSLFMAIVGGFICLAFLTLFLYRLKRDMRLRRKAEAELKNSELKYRRLIEDAGVVMFTSDIEGYFTFMSSRALLLTGYRSEELIGKHFSMLVAAEDLDKVTAHYRAQFKSRTSETVLEFLIHTKSGESKWVEQTGVLLYGAGQWMTGLQCIVKDIDEMKRYQLELAASELGRRENQYQLESIMNYSTSLIFIKDLDGRYLLVNKRFESFFHMSNDQLVGKTDRDLEPRDVADRYHQVDDWVLKHREAKEVEETVLLEDGPHHYMIVKFPLFDNSGDIYGLCGIATDISDRIHYEQQLIEARRIAEEAEHSQERFLANVSHEIRTPLSAIIGMTSLLTGSPLNPEQQDFAGGIFESANTLLVLINDILDFSKIKAGKLTIENISFDLVGQVHKTLYPLRHKAVEKHLKFAVNLDPAIPAVLIGDPYRLSQVLVNLISNAIKFTDAGTISLTVSVRQREAEKIWIEFTVTDTGIGIRADQLKSIFESFTQSSPEITRRYGGTGLGLTITRQLTELQGGAIRVESELGKGSQFEVSLPFAQSAEDDAFPQSSLKTDDTHLVPEALKGTRLLVAEDNLINQKVFRYTLQKAGIEADIVGNGRELITRLESGKRYDLILSDIRMPEIDGYQATAYIREVLKMDIPILAMTASARREGEDALEKGVTDFISKPFTIPELYEQMTRYILAADPDTEPDDEVAAPHAGPMLYDLSLLRDMEDPANECEVIELFLTATPPMLESLREKVGSKSWHDVYLQVHELKSSLGIFKMTPILELVARMEANARAGERLDEMPGLADQVLALFQEVQPLLRREMNKIRVLKG